MKKLLTIILALVLILSLTACGEGGSGTKDDGGMAEGDNKESTGFDTSKGLLYLCLNLGDKGFNDNGWWGTQDAAEKYGMDATYIELGQDRATYESAFLDACDSGKYSVLITQSNYGLADLCVKYGADYPDMKFIAFDAGTTADFSPAPNVYGAAFAQNEGSWLAGVVAGTLTENDHVGTYIFQDVPVGNDFLVGYLEGARYANPNCKIEWTYGPSSGSNTAQTIELCNVMLDSGCDILYVVSGADTISVADKVTTERGGIENGYYIIGCDADQYEAALENPATVAAAECIISSMVKDVRATVTSCVDRAYEGTLPFGTVELLGLDDGAVVCLANDHFRDIAPQEVQDAYDNALKAISDGTVSVSTYFQFKDYDEYLTYRDSFRG